MLPARFCRRSLHVVLGLAVSLVPAVAAAQTWYASDSATLTTAISNANLSGGTIVLTNNITLASELPAIAASVTVEGNNFTLSGNNQYRGLVVTGIETSISVTIQNLTIANAVAAGGAGGNGTTGGGGGAGLGGALYVSSVGAGFASGASVTVSNVNIVSSAAVGGAGGSAIAGALGGGGGGGIGGAGGTGNALAGGGGGGFGVSATGGNPGTSGGSGTLTFAPPGGSSSSSTGGFNAGGGAGGAPVSPYGEAGAGGGSAGLAPAGGPPANNGGDGGFGGGGGGTSIVFYTFGKGGAGGYGGGGGGGRGDVGGAGGFGGGGGGSDIGPGAGGFAGGTGSTGGGGGGAGLGGAVFVESGSSLSVAGAFTVNGNSVTGGAGGQGAASGSALGSGLFLDGGILFVSTDANVTINNDIAGINGTGIVKSGAGTLALSGNNTYDGGTTISQGTVSVSNGSALGGGSVLLQNGTTLAFTGSGTFSNNASISGAGTFRVSPGQTATWNGVVSNFIDSSFAGALNVSGGGTLVLGNYTNAYSGGTVVTGGSTVSIAADGALGAVGAGITLGDATSSGTLAITVGLFASTRPIALGSGGGAIDTSSSSIATLTGAITGAGGLTKGGLGTLVLGAANSYGGATTVNAGTLVAGAVGAFGSAPSLAIASGATVDFNGFSQSINTLSGGGSVALTRGATLTLGLNNASSTFGGSLTGTGGLVKGGGGTLTLTGANSYTGGTAVNGGVLLGTTASLQGNIANNAAVVFDQSSDGTYAGSMTGSGSLGKSGAGNLTLTGSNSYTGGTFISSGTLTGTSSSLQGPIVNDGTLIFDQTGDGTFNGTIFGSGSVTKRGAGALTIVGANPFGGTLDIGEGTIALNGGFAGDVNVGSAGTLRGGGIIGGSLGLAGSLFVTGPGSTSAGFNALRVNPTQAATVSPLIVNGNLTTTPGSVLAFTVTPAGAPPIAVNGSATLNGSLVNVTINDPNPARYATYVALTSNALTASGLTAGIPAPGIVPVLKTDAKDLYVTLLNENIPLAGLTTSSNTASVAGAIDRIKPGATGDLGLVIQELTALDNQQLNQALGQLDGELNASEARLAIDESLAISDLIRDEISERDPDREDTRPGVGRQSIRWWFDLTGDHTSYTPSGVSSAIANVGGGAGGFDFRPASRVTVGGGGSFSQGALSLLGGSSNLNAPRGFGYAGLTFGPFSFHGGGSVARTGYSTQRPIAFAATAPTVSGPQPLTGGINRQAQSDQSGVTRDGWTELKDSLRVNAWNFDWKLGWRAATYDRNQFTETGASAISLLGLAQTISTKEADLNLLAFRKRGTWRPRIEMNYRRELGDNLTSASEQFAGLPASGFVVNGIPIPLNQFHGIAGLTFRSALGMEYTLEYETLRAVGEDSQGVHLRVRFR